MATYDAELQTMRLRTAVAEELSRSSVAQANAAIKAQKAAERDDRAARARSNTPP